MTGYSNEEQAIISFFPITIFLTITREKICLPTWITDQWFILKRKKLKRKVYNAKLILEKHIIDQTKEFIASKMDFILKQAALKHGGRSPLFCSQFSVLIYSKSF